jgi:hypothetical protein
VAFDYCYGEDVPGVGGDYVGGDEVDLVGAVEDVVGGQAAAVGVAAAALGAFDLYAEELSGAFDGEVVGGVVSPGLGDAEAEFGGAGHETQLRPLAARFGVGDVDPLNWHGVLGGLGFLELRLELGLDNKKRGLFGPRWLFCLYFYFIKLGGGNWTFWRGNFVFGCKGLGGIGWRGGLDRV